MIPKSGHAGLTSTAKHNRGIHEQCWYEPVLSIDERDGHQYRGLHAGDCEPHAKAKLLVQEDE